jgi:peptidoglycan/LPS O-acetylase OafA/YrhL
MMWEARNAEHWSFTTTYDTKSAMGERLQALDNLTGLRGVAAYSVLVGHAINLSFRFVEQPGVTAFEGLATGLAHVGMSLFFVLSGFVIHYNYAALFAGTPFWRATRTFFVARFARLFPLYALAVFMGWQSLPPDYIGFRPDVALAYLTMTQSWFNMEQAAFPPAWSVSTEWFFYFVFVAIVATGLRVRRPVLWLVAAIVVWPLLLAWAMLHADAIYELVTTYLWFGNRISAEPSTWVWYYCPLLRVAEFVVGMLASRIYQQGGGGGNILTAIGSVWCGGFLMAAALEASPLGLFQQNFGFTPGIVCIVLGTSLQSSVVSRVLSSWPMRSAGEISYSVYMLQVWTLHAVAGVFYVGALDATGLVAATLKVILMCVVTTFTAVGCYRLLEAPARNWLRRVLMSRPRHPSLDRLGRVSEM